MYLIPVSNNEQGKLAIKVSTFYLETTKDTPGRHDRFWAGKTATTMGASRAHHYDLLRCLAGLTSHGGPDTILF